MYKLRILIAVTCMLLSFSSIYAIMLTRNVDPEYYLSTKQECIELEDPTGCGIGVYPCTITVSATEINRPVYDTRSSGGICLNPLGYD